MKVAAVLVFAVLLIVPAKASAGSLACDLEGGGEIAGEDRMLELLDGADDIRALLDAQMAGWWMSGRDQGWDMGVAPGPLSVDDARAAIEETLSTRLAPDDVAFLMSTLHLYAMPYGDDELRALADELDTRMSEAFGERFFWVVDWGCLDGEAWRVEVGLYADATAEDIAAVRELLEPYGDMVRLYLDGLLTPPTAGGGTTAGYLRSFIKLRSPKRCVRTRTINFKTRPAARALIRRITVSVSGHRRKLTDGIRLTIRLKRHGVTPVRVVIRAADGSRLAHTYRFRRC